MNIRPQRVEAVVPKTKTARECRPKRNSNEPSSYLGALASIAFPTERLQVILLGHAALRHRNDMVDFQKQMRLFGSADSASLAPMAVAIENIATKRTRHQGTLASYALLPFDAIV